MNSPLFNKNWEHTPPLKFLHWRAKMHKMSKLINHFTVGLICKRVYTGRFHWAGVFSHTLVYSQIELTVIPYLLLPCTVLFSLILNEWPAIGFEQVTNASLTNTITMSYYDSVFFFLRAIWNMPSRLNSVVIVLLLFVVVLYWIASYAGFPAVFCSGGGLPHMKSTHVHQHFRILMHFYWHKTSLFSEREKWHNFQQQMSYI